ncbi:uncharacterized protein BYT42DRAFT_546724 [Radiomyces spectabilis]|uniref:uncharacterized protein n=1 Tax=Radiomyces spectabilis TaxID=64574 RepID=UPI00221E80CF|nr:uncharacterized protein BYT42DRAFT_546724 [Radiomyces spectabilis]KAI8375990.1 hypothetical protein BYT42DRAFT_546724 [Radiomyces spectabilis]
MPGMESTSPSFAPSPHGRLLSENFPQFSTGSSSPFPHGHQHQQQEMHRLRQLQHQAALQQQQAILHQQMMSVYHQQQQSPQPFYGFGHEQPHASVEPSSPSYYSMQTDQKSHISGAIKKTQNEAQRRAEHNATERARRENLNDKFQQLAHCLPNLNDRRPSKGRIIESTLEFVKQTVSKEERYLNEINELRKANQELQRQLATGSVIDDTEDTQSMSAFSDRLSHKSSCSSFVATPSVANSGKSPLYQHPYPSQWSTGTNHLQGLVSSPFDDNGSDDDISTNGEDIDSKTSLSHPYNCMMTMPTDYASLSKLHVSSSSLPLSDFQVKFDPFLQH